MILPDLSIAGSRQPPASGTWVSLLAALRSKRLLALSIERQTNNGQHSHPRTSALLIS
jgi:hypothetical protein